MINEQSDITSKSASSATYRPWFNSKASIYPIYVQQWVHWQVNEEHKTPHEILQMIWGVLYQRYDLELAAKMSNPSELRLYLVAIIKKYEKEEFVNEMVNELHQLPHDELLKRAKEIYLMQYQMDKVEKYCALFTRKRIILKIESIEQQKKLNQDDFNVWFKKRNVELSQESNKYMDERVSDEKLTLKKHITTFEPSDFFDIHFVTYIADRLSRKDFVLLRARYTIKEKDKFIMMVNQGVRSDYNIHCYWWYGALLFGLITTAVTSATVAGLFEKGQERFNPILEKFWELESHDPIFRGAGFGVFGIALILLWMLHPVDEQPAQKNAKVIKVNG